MAIKNISQRKFAQLIPVPLSFETEIGEQVEWRANNAGTIIGAVAKEKTRGGWLCIVLGKDKLGEFRVCTLELGMESQQAASLRLLNAMGVAEKTGTARRRTRR